VALGIRRLCEHRVQAAWRFSLFLPHFPRALQGRAKAGRERLYPPVTLFWAFLFQVLTRRDKRSKPSLGTAACLGLSQSLLNREPKNDGPSPINCSPNPGTSSRKSPTVKDAALPLK